MKKSSRRMILEGCRRRVRMMSQAFMLGVILVCLQGCSSSLPDALSPGFRVPFTRVTYLDGSYDTFQQYQGQRVAVLFWAKWCSKSRKAIEAFHHLATEYGDRAVFLAVSLDPFKEEEAVKSFLTAQGYLSHEIHHAFSGNGPDDEAVMAFRAFEIPIGFIVDEGGVVEVSSHDMDDLEEGLQ